MARNTTIVTENKTEKKNNKIYAIVLWKATRNRMKEAKTKIKLKLKAQIS
jgi:hypothetical protein